MDLAHPMTPPATGQWLDGRLVRLRALEPEDLDVLYDWENDSTVWAQGCTLAPYSRYALREYISAAADADLYTCRQLRLMIVSKSAGHAVGTLDLYDFDPHHRRAGVGILIDAAHRRCGLGREAVTLLTAYAFDILCLHQLYVHVPADNMPSLRLFFSAGFRACATLPGWLRTSAGFSDVVVMTRINPRDS